MWSELGKVAGEVEQDADFASFGFRRLRRRRWLSPSSSSSSPPQAAITSANIASRVSRTVESGRSAFLGASMHSG
jgi:hypothetical protein